MIMIECARTPILYSPLCSVISAASLYLHFVIVAISYDAQDTCYLILTLPTPSLVCTPQCSTTITINLGLTVYVPGSAAGGHMPYLKFRASCTRVKHVSDWSRVYERLGVGKDPY